MLLQDIRFAWRAMRRNPEFTSLGIAILALGIGTTTAVFGVVEAVLLRPLPYGDPSRLVSISRANPRSGKPDSRVTLSDVETWRSQTRQLRGIGSFVYTQLPVKIGDQTFALVTAAVDPELLVTLGTAPALGSNFGGSGSSHPDHSAIVSHRVWLDTLGADRGAVGRTIAVDGEPYTITGVLPESFQFPRADASYFDESVGLLIPVANIASSWGGFSSQWFAIGRLDNGVTADQAESELDAIATHMASGVPGSGAGPVRVLPLADQTTSQVRPALLLILGSSGVLLLIACVNVMSLWLSRGAARAREIAIRKAIGAGTARVARQLLTESACLAFAAGALGVLLARAFQDAIVSASPIHLPVSGRIGIDWRVLAFAIAVSAVAAIVAGLLPSLHVSLEREHMAGGSGTRSTRGQALAAIQRALTVAQVALGLALLTTAGLLVNSLWRMGSVDPGFRTRGVLGFTLSVPSDHPRKLNAALYDRMLSGLAALPGVRSVGWITYLPPEQRKGVFVPLTIAGRPPAQPGERLFCNLQVTSEEYFATLDIPFLAGRPFSNTDNSGSAPVAIVNEALARRYFPQSPIGRRVQTAFDQRPREIVGVIRGIRDRGLAVPEYPAVYVPFRQLALGYGSIAVRSDAPTAALVAAIRSRIAQIDPGIPLKDFQTLDERVHESLGEPRFYTVIAAVCASMAILFVTLGLYGVVAYSVSRRIPEIGIRLAIGAQRGAIARMIVRQGVTMAIAGAAIGAALAFWAARLLERWLFAISPADPGTFAAATAFVVAVTAAASYIPARRASRIDPLAALRHD